MKTSTSNRNFNKACQRIETGKVFESLTVYEQARTLYRQLASTVAPDLHPEEPEADRVLGLLNIQWDEFQKRLRFKKQDPISIKTRKASYIIDPSTEHVIGPVREFEVQDQAETLMVSIAKVPRDNDLVIRERYTLETISARKALGGQYFSQYVPQLQDSFQYCDDKHRILEGNVTTGCDPDLFLTVEEIARRFAPSGHGVHPKDVAWIWRRVLTVIGYAQVNHIVHTAITPDRILIDTQNHNVILKGWYYSVEEGDKLVAIDNRYLYWYPETYRSQRKGVTTSLDASFGARCMQILLSPTESVPKPLKIHFEGIAQLLPNSDVTDIMSYFDDILERLWGPRAFHEFQWPK